jgi:hypothetical protein
MVDQTEIASDLRMLGWSGLLARVGGGRPDVGPPRKLPVLPTVPVGAHIDLSFPRMRVVALTLLALMIGGCVRQEPSEPLVYDLGSSTPRPTKAQQAEIERGFAVSEAERAVKQGHIVRRLSDDQCIKLTVAQEKPGSPSPYAQGGLWRAGEPSIYNRFLTPQENYCIELSRSHVSQADNRFPGMLPEGAYAVPLGNGAWLIHFH